MFCSNCGKEIKVNDKFCAYCGVSVRTNNLGSTQEIKSLSNLTSSSLKNLDIDKVQLLLISAVMLFIVCCPVYKVLEVGPYKVYGGSEFFMQARVENPNLLEVIEDILNPELRNWSEVEKLFFPRMVLGFIEIVLVLVGISFFKDLIISNEPVKDYVMAATILAVSYGGVSFWLCYAYRNYLETISSYEASNSVTVTTMVWLLILIPLVNYFTVVQVYYLDKTSDEKVTDDRDSDNGTGFYKGENKTEFNSENMQFITDYGTNYENVVLDSTYFSKVELVENKVSSDNAIRYWLKITFREDGKEILSELTYNLCEEKGKLWIVYKGKVILATRIMSPISEGVYWIGCNTYEQAEEVYTELYNSYSGR